MAGIEVGDVVPIRSSSGGVETVEVMTIAADYLVVRHTEAPLSSPYHIVKTEIQPWDGTLTATDSYQKDLQLPTHSIQNMLNKLRSCIQLKSIPHLMQVKGLTVDHYVNLCYRSDLSPPSAQTLAYDYLCTVMQACLSLCTQCPLPQFLFGLGLLCKVLAKGVLFDTSVIYDHFLQFHGPECSLELTHQIHHSYLQNEGYLSALRLIPLFHTHKRLPSALYRVYTESILSSYRQYRFQSVSEAKQTLRFLEELDYNLLTFGMKVVCDPGLFYTIKRLQTTICIELLNIQPTRFDAIEYFSAILKANSRDKHYREILQEFSFTEHRLASLIRGLPDYMKDYFIKACCLGSFSIDSLFTYMGSDKKWSSMLSAEFFTELLQYNSTQFLRKLPSEDVEFCKKCVQDSEKQLLSYGVEFDVIRQFIPDFEWNTDRLLMLANSIYAEAEKEKMLLDYFRTSQDLLQLLPLPETTHSTEYGKLLSLFYNATVVRCMWIREKTRWRRVPLALFVSAWSEFG